MSRTLLSKIKKIPLVAQARALLRRRLPKGLVYHSAKHTDDVIREVLLFAQTDGLNEREIDLLVVAAAFHDTGFIDRFANNEPIGAERAVQAMNDGGGYSKREIALVRQMILDTKLRKTRRGPKQISTTRLSGYLCDADVSNLGRTDFFRMAELVRKETGLLDKKAFYQGLVKFIECHEWYTPAAQSLRENQKQANLAALRRKFATAPAVAPQPIGRRGSE